MENLNLTYATWKVVRTTLAGTTYYAQHDNEYILILVDTTQKLVSLARLIRVPTASADVLNFESVIKPTAVLVATVDEAIATEVY